MDPLLFALIESEHRWDEHYATVDETDLQPVAYLLDGEGGQMEVFADGSHVTTRDGRIA